VEDIDLEIKKPIIEKFTILTENFSKKTIDNLIGILEESYYSPG